MINPTFYKNGFILCFHEIAMPKYEAIIKFFNKYFDLISLNKFIHLLNNGITLERKFVITLDDGWYNTSTNVVDYSIKNDLPITIYVPTIILDGKTNLWFENFNEKMEYLSKGKNSINNKEKIKVMFKSMSSKESYEYLKEFYINNKIENNSFIDKSFVIEKSRNNNISFQSHTHDHQSIISQLDRNIEKQYKKSKYILENLTQKQVNHLCYPYGLKEDIGLNGLEISKKYFLSAVTMNRGLVNHKSDLHFLPRISFYDKDNTLSMIAKIISSKSL